MTHVRASHIGHGIAIFLLVGAAIRHAPPEPEEIAMNVRLLSVSAVAALSLACARSAVAGTSVQISYVAPAVVYAPPVRPPYYYVPVRTVVVAPPPVPVYVAPPPPRPPVVLYAPPARVTYAAPVYAAPVVVLH
jgi:hypothetical protein